MNELGPWDATFSFMNGFNISLQDLLGALGALRIKLVSSIYQSYSVDFVVRNV